MTTLNPNDSSSSITFSDITFYVTSFLMIFAPIIGYIDQIIKFRMLKSSEGYSSKISLILFFSNTLRIFFWLGKRFGVVLLYQSIVMIIMQAVLLVTCLNYRNKAENDDFNLQNFWEWPYLSDYFHFFSGFVIFMGILTPIMGYDNIAYFEVLGVLSAMVEASLQLPQIYKNFMLKSGSSLSYVLVATWIIGDLFKSGYLLKENQPLQLLICAFVQVLFDIIIILQVFFYNRIRETKIVTEMREQSVIRAVQSEREN